MGSIPFVSAVGSVSASPVTLQLFDSASDVVLLSSGPFCCVANFTFHFHVDFTLKASEEFRSRIHRGHRRRWHNSDDLLIRLCMLSGRICNGDIGVMVMDVLMYISKNFP